MDLASTPLMARRGGGASDASEGVKRATNPVDIGSVLSNVRYSSRYAVTLAYASDMARRVREALGHAVVYTPQDDVVRFLALDTARRQGSPLKEEWAPVDGGEVVLMVHSSVQFAGAVEASVGADSTVAAGAGTADIRAEAQAAMLARVRMLFPTLPDPLRAALHVLW